MHRLESLEDEMSGVVTFEFDNGKRLSLDRMAVELYGLPAMLREHGCADLVPNERAPVMQDGIQIGSVPPAFDPLFIKSTSPLYDPRPGDFRRDGSRWIASSALGLGDLEAVPGFQFERS